MTESRRCELGESNSSVDEEEVQSPHELAPEDYDPNDYADYSTGEASSPEFNITESDTSGFQGGEIPYDPSEAVIKERRSADFKKISEAVQEAAGSIFSGKASLPEFNITESDASGFQVNKASEPPTFNANVEVGYVPQSQFGQGVSYTDTSLNKQNIYSGYFDANNSHQGGPQSQQVEVKTTFSAVKEKVSLEQQVDLIFEIIQSSYSRIAFVNGGATFLYDKFRQRLLLEDYKSISDNVATFYRKEYRKEINGKAARLAFGHFKSLSLASFTDIVFGRVLCGFGGKHYLNIDDLHAVEFGIDGIFQIKQVSWPVIPLEQSSPLLLRYEFTSISPSLDLKQIFDGTALPSNFDLVILAWMMLVWMPDRKQVLLELSGNLSKPISDAQVLIKQLLDPAKNPLINEVSNRKEGFNSLVYKQYLLSFDQVRSLTQSQQEHICCLLEGMTVPLKIKGVKTGEEIQAVRPVIINSCGDVITDHKLLGSSISINVSEESLTSHNASSAIIAPVPFIHGLIKLFSLTFSILHYQRHDPVFDEFKELSDLCKVGMAVAEALGRDPKEFLEQLRAVKKDREELVFYEYPVAQAVMKLLTEEPSGIIELPVFKWLSEIKENPATKDLSEEWPKTPRGLGAKFKDCQDLLCGLGVKLESLGRQKNHYWRAELLNKEPVQAAVQNSDEERAGPNPLVNTIFQKRKAE